MSRSAFVSKKVRVATMLRTELEREETGGVLEALGVGLLVIRERHGYHSAEARAVERTILLLTNKMK
jgi:hypothetical protein